ncbi:MAG TPA: hypothetical protein VM554_12775 [Acidisarcina sp.]|nr:hypothetical protein [Acidisarcina sp.]
MPKTTLFACALILFSFPANLHSQPASRQGIIVACECHGMIAEASLSYLRDRIAASSRYEERRDSEENEKIYPKISIITLDDNADPGGAVQIAVSEVILYHSAFLGQRVGLCGKNTTSGCVDGIFSFADKVISQYVNNK